MITAAHIITALGSGGAERMLYLVASRTAQSSDVRNVVICLSDEGYYGPRLREAGIELYCIGMRRGQLSPTAIVSLVALLRQLRPDVIMTWLYHADLLGTLAARFAGVRRIVWNIRCSDIDFKLYAPTTRRIVKVLARLSRVPWAIAANSEAGRQVHASLGYRPKRWVYLPNGYDCDLWRPDAEERAHVRCEFGLSEADRVIGLIARVDPQKDHASFLAAAAELETRRRDVRVLLVGRGTRELRVPDGIRPFTIAAGERTDVPRLMRALDLLVSSSGYGEGFPNVIGEAMASGVPCVATDVGDSALIIGDTGRIVPPRDTVALAETIGALLDLSHEELRALGMRARARIEAEFSLGGCLARYEELLRTAAGAEARGVRLEKCVDIIQ